MKKIISAVLIAATLLSMVCVSTSAAGVLLDMNFENMEVFTEKFVAGHFFTGDGMLYGYSEAKALQTRYTEDDEGYLVDGPTVWMTYDATITLMVADDPVSEADRFINLIYCNDNMPIEGVAESRVQMSFTYDIQNRCFRFAPGWNNTDESLQFMAPVYMEVPTDNATEEITLGISVSKDRMRCFYNDQLIFDLNDPNYYIAMERPSPFLFWQDGNEVLITNITVADNGYLFPFEVETDPVVTTAPVGSEPAGSDVVTDPIVTDPIDGTTAGGNNNNGGNDAPADTSVTTTATSIVDVTDDKGDVVTNEAGEKVTSAVIVTEKPAETTTAIVQVTDEKGQAVTNEAGEKVTSVITNAPSTAATNNNRPQGGNATQTGDATFAVIAAMVVALGSALIVKKVTVK